MHVDRQGKTLIVKVNSDLDHRSASVLKNRLAQEWQREVAQNYLFIMTGMEFMDSSGLGLLLGRYREAKERGGKTAVAGLNSQAKRIMELAGVLKIIPAFSNEQEGLNYLEG